MTIFKDPPALEFQRLERYYWFNPRAVLRLGPNLFLVRFTGDKKGQSKVQRVGLIQWKKLNTQYNPVPTHAWHQVAGIKRGSRAGSHALRMWAGVSYDNSYPIHLEGYLKDTKEDWSFGIDLMVKTFKNIAPEEFDHAPIEHYGEALSNV